MSFKSVWSKLQKPGGRVESSLVDTSYSRCSTNSEFGLLKEVLIYIPDKRIESIANPQVVRHLAQLNWRKLGDEIQSLIEVYRSININVCQLETEDFFPQILRCRDLFLNTPSGCLIARMANEVRIGEELVLNQSLGAFHFPILYSVQSPAVYEATDSLWLGPKKILLNLGKNTNEDAKTQLHWILAQQGVSIDSLHSYGNFEHLLDVVQIVDKTTALVRREMVDPGLVKTLLHNNFKVIGVDESIETQERFGFGFVVVAPRQVIIANHCPGLKAILSENDINIIAEVPTTELGKAGCGLAQFTGILNREKIFLETEGS
ncbi:MAG: hypothetical protein H6623_08125 [Bdellovibrionaceae bacterium]|nr:hypothetical protein [Pseudobdellovibrionaceae bacterium]